MVVLGFKEFLLWTLINHSVSKTSLSVMRTMVLRLLCSYLCIIGFSHAGTCDLSMSHGGRKPNLITRCEMLNRHSGRSTCHCLISRSPNEVHGLKPSCGRHDEPWPVCLYYLMGEIFVGSRPCDVCFDRYSASSCD
jgi:hypothetical protein